MLAMVSVSWLALAAVRSTSTGSLGRPQEAVEGSRNRLERERSTPEPFEEDLLGLHVEQSADARGSALGG